MLKTSQITNLQQLLFFFNTKRMAENLCTVNAWGVQRSTVSKFRQFCARDEKKISASDVSVKIRNLHGSQFFLTKKFVIQLRAQKHPLGSFGPPGP